MGFEIAAPGRIVLGAGCLRESGQAIAAHGTRALLVTGRDSSRAKPLVDVLRESKVTSVVFSVAGEPTIPLARQGTALALEEKCDLVIGMGGGSAIDAAKAIAALVANGGDPLDYVEIVGRALPLPRPSLPFVALPTTAGSGAEVTRNAVLISPEHCLKVSLRSPHLFAKLVVVDPVLARDLPPMETASTGLDALTQLVESFTSTRANQFTEGLCREGITNVARSLGRAVARGSTDLAAREEMAIASLFSGLALANSGLGAVHGLAAPLGGMYPVPHGIVCARLLPIVMTANIRALEQRPTDGGVARQRYAEVARLLTGNRHAEPCDGVSWVADLVADLQIPSLAAYGVTAGGLDTVVARAENASSMKANPVRLSSGELRQLVEQALR
ncbi:MAG: iron-containing alcohol dehydrogenase [Pseudomonadota bacterium]